MKGGLEHRRDERPVEFRGDDFSRVPVLESRPRPSDVDQ